MPTDLCTSSTLGASVSEDGQDNELEVRNTELIAPVELNQPQQGR